MSVKNDRRRRRIMNRWLSMIAVLAAAATMTAGIGVIVDKLFPAPKIPVQLTGTQMQELEETIAKLRRQMSEFHAYSKATDEKIAALGQLGKLPGNAIIASQIAKVRSEVTELRTELSKSNEVILDNPEKALSMPLLKKDISNLQESYRNDLVALRQEISRVYGQNKWFIGLMFTMAVGLLGLAINNLVQSRKGE